MPERAEKWKNFWRKYKGWIVLSSMIPIVGAIGVIWITTMLFPVFWGRPEYLGLRFGYWSDLNRMIYAIDEIPNIEYVDWAGNQDLTLEELFITVRIDSRKEIDIVFGQDEPIRDLPHDELVVALEKRIRSELAKKEAKESQQK